MAFLIVIVGAIFVVLGLIGLLIWETEKERERER